MNCSSSGLGHFSKSFLQIVQKQKSTGGLIRDSGFGEQTHMARSVCLVYVDQCKGWCGGSPASDSDNQKEQRKDAIQSMTSQPSSVIVPEIYRYLSVLSGKR